MAEEEIKAIASDLGMKILKDESGSTHIIWE